MPQYRKNFLCSLIILFIVFNTSKANAQSVFFNTQFDYTPTQPPNFLSTVTTDKNQVYFNANDYALYVYDKKDFSLKYKTATNRKTNDPSHIYKNTLITGSFKNGKHQCVFINKTTGETEQTLTIPPLKTEPLFINDSIFYGTTVDEDGGQLLSYDVKNNKLLWKRFIGHGATYKPYVVNGQLLANFDDSIWKKVSFEGKFIENESSVKNINFYQFTHDQKKITNEFLANYFSNKESIKIKSSTKNTVLLNPKKLIVLENTLKTTTIIHLTKRIQLPDEGENDYLEILKIEPENVWFFYQNLVVNYDIKKNKLVKTYDLTKWNAHQAILEEDTIWLISKNDGQLYGIQLEITQRQLDEKAARLKYFECTRPDKARIEAQKAAEEKYKSKN